MSDLEVRVVSKELYLKNSAIEYDRVLRAAKRESNIKEIRSIMGKESFDVRVVKGTLTYKESKKIAKRLGIKPTIEKSYICVYAQIDSYEIKSDEVAEINIEGNTYYRNEKGKYKKNEFDVFGVEESRHWIKHPIDLEELDSDTDYMQYSNYFKITIVRYVKDV